MALKAYGITFAGVGVINRTVKSFFYSTAYMVVKGITGGGDSHRLPNELRVLQPELRYDIQRIGIRTNNHRTITLYLPHYLN